MKIPCPNCNQSLEIPDDLKGQTIECPACNTNLIVPMTEKQTDEDSDTENKGAKQFQKYKSNLESAFNKTVNTKNSLFHAVPDFTNCKGCDNKLSTKAWKCQTCGTPIGQTQRAFQFAGFIILVFFMIFVNHDARYGSEIMTFAIMLCIVFFTIGRMFKGKQ